MDIRKLLITTKFRHERMYQPGFCNFYIPKPLGTYKLINP